MRTLLLAHRDPHQPPPDGANSALALRATQGLVLWVLSWSTHCSGMSSVFVRNPDVISLQRVTSGCSVATVPSDWKIRSTAICKHEEVPFSFLLTLLPLSFTGQCFQERRPGPADGRDVLVSAPGIQESSSGLRRRRKGEAPRVAPSAAPPTARSGRPASQAGAEDPRRPGSMPKGRREQRGMLATQGIPQISTVVLGDRVSFIDEKTKAQIGRGHQLVDERSGIQTQVCLTPCILLPRPHSAPGARAVQRQVCRFAAGQAPLGDAVFPSKPLSTPGKQDGKHQGGMLAPSSTAHQKGLGQGHVGAASSLHFSPFWSPHHT